MKKLTEIYKTIFTETIDLVESMIDEDYPTSFNMEEFKSFTNFSKRVKYCEENLKRVASGSGRIVYIIDNEKVLKLAKNQKGVAQCEVEITYSQYHDIADITAITFDAHPDSLWVEMELARKLRAADFKQIVGYDFKEFGNAVHYYGFEANGRGIGRLQKPEKYDEMWENEFIMEIFTFIGNYGLSKVGDLARMNSYGVVKRNGQDAIVMIDYGLTDDVYDNYYS